MWFATTRLELYSVLIISSSGHNPGTSVASCLLFISYSRQLRSEQMCLSGSPRYEGSVV